MSRLKQIRIKNVLMLTLAGIVNAFGITIFLAPVKLYDGGISGADKTMIYFIVNRFQITRLRDLIHELDPRAYITISEVADVYSVNHSGNGGSHE